MNSQRILEQAALALSPSTKEQITALFYALETVEPDGLAIKDAETVRQSVAALAEIAAFGDLPERRLAHKLAWQLAFACGIYPASIDELYRNISTGKLPNFTVPAMNMRAIAFQSASAVFSAMREHNVGAAIFELSRGEIAFTGQRPMEYATVILCASIAEEHAGPLFLQGDHFQVSASRYGTDPDLELTTIKKLIAEAVEAGFYNIDIDTSTLVDLSFDTVDEQQRPNYLLSAELANFVRKLEPEGITISLGGEIGEVGEDNSTAEEVEAFLTGVNSHLDPDTAGLTKLSIQSGTKHGGNVLKDGSFGEMNINFDLITELTNTCRTYSGVAGCVQHGASMLTLKKLGRLPASECIEVHLAAAFLNAVYEQLPEPLVASADEWASVHFADEWKSQWSKEQFLHHARRYPIGHFKREWWDATECHEALRTAIYDLTVAYFTALNAINTSQLVTETIKHQPQQWQQPQIDQQQELENEIVIRDLAD